MCQVKRESSPCESSSSIASTSSAAAATVPAGAIKKRPAGRTRYRETRHPVFRGVRSRSRAGGRCRWVCEVRVPGHRGRRLWLGTFESLEHAARAHDAAMLAVLGAAADHGCLLNFPDSAWLLDVPPLGSDGADVIRRAMARAVEAFLMLRSSSRHDAEDAMSATSDTTMTPAAVHDDDAATEEAKGDERSPFEMDVMGDMGAGLYYASLAQGLLMDPPAASDASWCCDDSDVAVVPLWTY